MVLENYLSHFKTDLKIDQNLKIDTKRTSLKSKSTYKNDGHNTNSKDTNKSKRPRKRKPHDTFAICLGILCLTTTYLYFRIGPMLLLKPTPTTTTTTTPKTTISSTTTTTPTPTSAELTDGEYFSSIVKLKELARLEESIIVEMIIVINNWTTLNSSSSKDLWHKGLSKIKSYVADYNSSITPMLFETSDVEKVVVSHPLISHRTIRRILFNLPDVLIYNVEGRLENLNKIAALIQPAVTVNDFTGSVEGILRLQKTFLISSNDFANGRLQNIETKSGLTETDCFLIGFWVFNEMKRPSVSIEWIVQALRMFLRREVNDNSEMISMRMVRETLRNVIEKHNQAVANKNSWTFGKIVDSEMTRDTEYELMKTFSILSFSYQLLSESDDEINFNALCRGENLRNKTLTKKLKCYYKTDNPFLAIKPLKVEVHSYDPLIMQFYDFMPEYVMNHFINTTSHRLKRALVTEAYSKGKVASNLRIACSDWMKDEKGDEILSRVPQIIHEATELNLFPEGAAEPSQISTYGAIGGFFNYHYDTMHESHYLDYQALDDASISRGDRMATVMFYLTDLKLGGGTAFPKIGVVTQPVKGSAIFWYNLKKNGQRHDYTLHGGCPVLLGEKWVVNKWIRSGDQMFLRKCSLDLNK